MSTPLIKTGQPSVCVCLLAVPAGVLCYSPPVLCLPCLDRGGPAPSMRPQSVSCRPLQAGDQVGARHAADPGAGFRDPSQHAEGHLVNRGGHAAPGVWGGKATQKGILSTVEGMLRQAGGGGEGHGLPV